MNRRQPKCLSCLPGVNIRQAMDMAQFAYKESKTNKSFAAKLLNIWDKDRKYQKSFLTMTYQLLTLVCETRPELKLKRHEFIKLCMDFFTALSEKYFEMGRSGYTPFQISSYFAFQVFEEWVLNHFGSFEQYLDFTFVRKKYKREVSQQEDIFLLKESSTAEGLVELDISTFWTHYMEPNIMWFKKIKEQRKNDSETSHLRSFGHFGFYLFIFYL